MLPLLFKHYWKPIQLHDIPAIREDDGSASSLGAFRAHQAKRDQAYAEKHDGVKRNRNLGLDLLFFFSPEIFVQAVRCFSNEEIRVDDRHGLPFSFAFNISPRPDLDSCSSTSVIGVQTWNSLHTSRTYTSP